MQQAQQQTIETTIELLSKLMKLLAGLRPQEQTKGQQPEPDVPDQPSPQDRAQINHFCAESVKDLLSERGTEEMTDDGIRHVYRSEGYTLSANLTDGTGSPVYTVSSAEQGDIFSFQDNPTQPSQHVFFETEHSLSDKEASQLLQSLQTSLTTQLEKCQPLTQQPSNPPGDRRLSALQQDITQLGEFAPRGSKAAYFVVSAAQKMGNSDSVEGQRYSIRRNLDQSVELYDGKLPQPGSPKEPLMVVTQLGKVLCSEAMGPEHQAQFSQKYDELTAPQPTQQSKQSNPAQSKSQSKGGRE